ncbi:NAD-dependent epimerase/dehydratase family protein [Lentzea aerocolonigenes]|uniref:NAD-dependent epimerase/dehydratase family protein n=1 Tax=Lentzea aerocolonigenes TaxID=68170 RepID=UPI0004C3A767|nr:NAD-dependent epimerase/dehydratase family protein [Lentzea aerocolonigenes]MCP2242317.1 Nucleoside-diphosphate-sugar epimerase [Lentzea aerocolonigenes]
MHVFLTGGSGFVGGAVLRALRERGDTVAALARSENAANAVRDGGATPVVGDLDDHAALRLGCRDADLIVHAAAKLSGGPREHTAFRRVNVFGTANVLAAARAEQVPALVHLSTEQVVLGRRPLIGVDETQPYPHQHPGSYAETKAEAERLVLAAGDDGFRTVAVRPRLVWGAGDRTVLPALVAAARSGRLRWVDGGRYPTSTCHVRNVVEGALAAAERGTTGAAYFLTDGEPMEFRTFITALLDTQGVPAPTGTMPRPVASAAATACDVLWRLLPLPGEPPLSRTLLLDVLSACTVSDARARAELGYAGQVRVADGLAELRGDPVTEPGAGR